MSSKKYLRSARRVEMPADPADAKALKAWMNGVGVTTGIGCCRYERNNVRQCSNTTRDICEKDYGGTWSEQRCPSGPCQ